MPIVEDTGLLVDRHALACQQLRRRLDHVRRRGVERRDLVEHEPLVRQRLCDDDGGAQRRDRCRRRAVDALDQLDVVLAYEIDREVALDRHRQLRQQILVLLSDVEQHVVLERLGAFGIGCLDLGDPRRERCVEVLDDVHVLRESLHRLPELQLLLLERGVVLAELVLALVQGIQDRIDVGLRALVAVEVVAQLIAERNDAEQLAYARRLRGIEALDGLAQVEQRLRDLGASPRIHLWRPRTGVGRASDC